ncbi:hypothetical protein [Mycolicibacterium brumae]|uniref:Uncharacterized protein n=2 Tax=Mycolicibacterium brumae TaxID=85968 RepID=A0A2G5P4L1_9MYCO|nr:hypothetical protein [Mycolicibacterium brumae]RWA15386.1 hypothetical protein MBRU_19330 [Mycolicibacterium brumae DSM 44177]MCV7192232.1 hypothetical protein [Mycolicibacterium brumae]PIB72963.1 hypothetical protein CQY22_018605 [Mycolicibacterium brumae]UWW08173.1 hypothetical protein L2Z93_001216 [Mycolicibacterium brumae]UWW08178.1 hypothetical protein L2Z93_001221 [Mycolicibacterium brumae]
MTVVAHREPRGAQRWLIALIVIVFTAIPTAHCLAGAGQSAGSSATSTHAHAVAPSSDGFAEALSIAVIDHAHADPVPVDAWCSALGMVGVLIHADNPGRNLLVLAAVLLTLGALLWGRQPIRGPPRGTQVASSGRDILHRHCVIRR